MKLENIRKIMIYLLVIVVTLLLVPTFAVATSSNNNQILGDPFDYFTEEERAAIIETALELPESYRYLITPADKTDYDIKTEAKKIFNNLEFTQDTIFILIYSGKREIYITTGDSLQQRKLDDQFFRQEIEAYFIPYVTNTGDVAGALIELTKAISKDIPSQLDTCKNEIAIPQSPDSTESPILNGDEEVLNPWVVVAAIIVLFLALLLIIIIMIKIRNRNK